MLRLALIGQGIAGSPSPAVHEAFMRSCGIEGTYELHDVGAALLGEALRRIREDYRGCNVTIPHKAGVAALCDALEGDAALLQVVNTVTVEDGRLIGGNSDAAGFAVALANRGLTPQPGTAGLVLGAGGVASAVGLALARGGVSPLWICARRSGAAVRLARSLRAFAETRTLAWERGEVTSVLETLGVAVNATPVSISLLPLHPRDLPSSCTVADVRYAPVPVDVVTAAEDTGHRASDGREMLLQQAMLSFERWTGVEPPAAEGRAALERALA